MTSFHKSPEVAKRYLRRFYLIELIAGALPLIAGLVLIRYYNIWQPLFYIVIGLLVLLLIYCMTQPYFKYHYTHYRMNQNIIEVKRHFWFRRYDILKVERIQYVRWQNGPLLRHYKLQRLTLTTAGHEVTLPLLYAEDVERIEQHCLAYLQEVDSDV